jgi:hypothetical protein
MKNILIFTSLAFAASLSFAQPNSHWEINSAPGAIPGGNRGNVGFGVNTLPVITTGEGNTTIGYRAGASVNTGSYNCIIGSNFINASVAGGNKNVYIGSDGNGSGIVNGSGNLNVGVGFRSGLNVIGGSDRNVFIGAWAGTGAVWSPGGTTPWTNVIAIGSGTQTGFLPGTAATVMDNNNCILGNNDIKVGIGLSGRTPPVQNKLEINTDPANFCIGCTVPAPFTATSPFNTLIPGSWPGATGASGLRFRDLTSASTPVPIGTGSINPTKVLSVDGNGDVVLINPIASVTANNGLSFSGGNVQLGGSCGSLTVNAAALTNNRAVPLAGFNFVFSGNTGSVGIGTGCLPGNKLEVDNGTGPNNISGLRLTDLIGATPSTPNGQVLSVNAVGDVILTSPPTPTTSGCCIGNPCVANPLGTNPLTSDWQVPLGNFNYVFTKNAAGTGNVGIGDMLIPCTPGNLLDVSRGSVGNVSGLRLTDLRSPAIPLPANGQVLSVDPLNGDVILTSAPTFPTGLGATCPAPPAMGLSASHELPLNNFNFHFTAPANMPKAQVIIGQQPGLPTTCSALNARLSVLDDVLGNAIYGECILPNGGTNIGVHGFASSSISGASIGSLGEMQPGNPLSYGAGVAGTVGSINLSSMPTGPVGVFGSWGNSGSGLWAGYFDGDTYTQGTVYASNPLFNGSDRRFKKDIKRIENVTDKIKTLNAYTYNFKTDEFKKKNFDEGQQIGLIAQELKEVFPQLVKEDKEGYLAVNYQGMVPVLLEAIKEQQNRIEQLENKVQSLISTNANDLKQTNSQSIDLSDKNTIVLDQNVPNPFAESTVINYNIPTNFTKAQIIFSTSEGKVIKTVDVTVKGPGRINVFANDLSSGMYTYTLVVDGKTIDTKKMVKD